MIEITALAKRYGRVEVFRDLNLRFAGSGCLRILGVNGSGKSTLLRCIAGVTEADAGDMRWRGQPLGFAAEPSAQAQLGYLPPAVDLFPELEVGETLVLSARLRSAALPRVAIDALGIEPLWRQRVHALSTGQGRRFALCHALIGAPELLLLDEPTAGLDRQGRDAVHTLLAAWQSSGGVALLVSHEDELADALGASSWSFPG